MDGKSSRLREWRNPVPISMNDCLTVIFGGVEQGQFRGLSPENAQSATGAANTK
jgi:hypothetical protein